VNTYQNEEKLMKIPLLFPSFMIGITIFFSSVVISFNPTYANIEELKENGFRVPTNAEIDWEVDQLLNVRVLVPEYVKKKVYSTSEIKILVEKLNHPQKYVAAHVILSKLRGDIASAHAVAIDDGYDIWFSKLKVQIRYVFDGAFDKKSIIYPINHPENGTTYQAFIAERWKDRIETFNSFEISPKLNTHKGVSIPFHTWCDNSSFDLKGVSNDRIKWVYETFGIAKPVLLRVHRDEIARGNTKHVSHLLSLLNDESRFVAAHIALCCIFEITESYHHEHFGNHYELYLNGLHVVFKDSKITYPNLARQQAWIKYRWQTSLPWLMKHQIKKPDESNVELHP